MNSEKFENSYSGKVLIVWNYVNFVKFKLKIMGCVNWKRLLFLIRVFLKEERVINCF